MAIVLNALSTLLDAACSGTRQNHPVDGRSLEHPPAYPPPEGVRKLAVTKTMFSARRCAMACSSARLDESAVAGAQQRREGNNLLGPEFQSLTKSSCVSEQHAREDDGRAAGDWHFLQSAAPDNGAGCQPFFKLVEKPDPAPVW